MNENGTPTSRGIVVVGVDASEGARAAFRWAIAEARLRKARLRAVYAWTFSYPGAADYAYLSGGYLVGATAPNPDTDVSSLRRAAEKLLERESAALREEADGVEVEREVIEGRAAEVLVGAVSERDLLVVGSRGHGGFVGLLLGSVSQRCAHHAPCPVVIVPAPGHSSPTSEPVQGATQTALR